MKRSYNKKILLIYLVKTIGILTGFLSILMVVPRLTSNQEIYGVYTVCASLSMFFSYADLGFLSAGQKYAAEYFAQGDLKKEIKIIGFVLFFLSMLLVISALLLTIISFDPVIIIKSLNISNIDISRKLILILALFSPTIILQRFNSLVYSIRIEDYIYQIFDVIFNILKIFSIQFFVTSTSYDIVGYFLTIQCLSFLSALIGAIIAFKKYKYGFTDFLKAFKFSKEMFDATRSLAFSELLTTIAWILYFEFDSLILSKFYGLKIVALYAIGFTFLSFLRTFYNTLFSPFLSRFNHFVGNKDENGLFNNFNFLVKISLPVCILLPLTLILYMKNIIITWVGYNYVSSVLVCQLLIVTVALTAINIPIGYLILAKSQNFILRINAIILPILFYGCLLLFNFYLADKTLAVCKLITISSSLCLTIYLSYKKISPTILNAYLIPMKYIFFSVLVLVSIYYFLPNSTVIKPKTVTSYFNLMWHIVIPLGTSMLCYYLSDFELRSMLLRKIKLV